MIRRRALLVLGLALAGCASVPPSPPSPITKPTTRTAANPPPGIRYADPSPTTPFTVPVVEANGRMLLGVTIFRHTLHTRSGDRQAWTYVTSGLAARRQRELVMTLDDDGKRTDARFHKIPLTFFAEVFQLASEGRLVVAGGATMLGAPLDFGGVPVGGFIYLPAQHVDGVPELPSGALTVLPLLPDEAAIAESQGHARVLARLGEYHRQYPYPYWHDLSRPTVINRVEFDKSILTEVSRVHAYSLNAVQSPHRLLLRLHLDDRASLITPLTEANPKRALALLTAPDLTADSALVWMPGRSGLHVIGKDGSKAERRSGSFVVVVPDKGDHFDNLEDGFALGLSGADWARLRRAILDGEPVVLPATGDRPEVALETYEGEEINVTPASEDQRGPMRGIRLLTAETDLRRRTKAEDLAGLVKAIEAMLVAYPRPKKSFELRIRCELMPDKPPVYTLSATPPLGASDEKALRGRLASLAAPKVREGSVAFELQVVLGPE